MRMRRGAGFQSTSGLVGAAVREWRTINVPDVAKDPRYIPMNPETRSELIVPLFYKGRVIGVLDLEHTRAGFFNEEHERMLTTLGVADRHRHRKCAPLPGRAQAGARSSKKTLPWRARCSCGCCLPSAPQHRACRDGGAIFAGAFDWRRPLRLYRLRTQPHGHRAGRCKRKSRAGSAVCRAGERHYAFGRAAAIPIPHRCWRT